MPGGGDYKAWKGPKLLPLCMACLEKPIGLQSCFWHQFSRLDLCRARIASSREAAQQEIGKRAAIHHGAASAMIASFVCSCGHQPGRCRWRRLCCSTQESAVYLVTRIKTTEGPSCKLRAAVSQARSVSANMVPTLEGVEPKKSMQRFALRE